MKIFLVGATGRTGKWILKAALEGGHTVTALVREPIERVDLLPRLSIVAGDLFEVENLSDVLHGQDAIVSALNSKTVAHGTERLVLAAEAAKINRFIGIAGGGILQLDDKLLRRDRPDYPSMFLESSAQHLYAWRILQQSSLMWTLFCTPDLKNSEATGNADLRVDYMPQGKNSVACGDVASYLMRELEQREFINKRVGCAEKL